MKKQAIANSIVFLTTAVIIVIMVVAIISANQKPTYDFEEEVYVVQKGDSLWSISTEYCPESMRMEKYISLVMERNDLTSSTIHPGQNLVFFVDANGC